MHEFSLCDNYFGLSGRKGFQEPGVVPRQFFYQEVPMPEISLFVDESGESGTKSKYYLLTLVFHEQDPASISRSNFTKTPCMTRDCRIFRRTRLHC